MFLSKLSQTGDTIVEVLIAIAVGGTVLAGAYATTKQNVQSMQNSQDRSQAQKIAETQVENLRSAGSLASGQHCFTDTTMVVPDPAQPCNMSMSVNSQPVYTIAITAVDPSTYSVVVQWTSLNASINNVTLYYRPAKL